MYTQYTRGEMFTFSLGFVNCRWRYLDNRFLITVLEKTEQIRPQNRDALEKMNNKITLEVPKSQQVKTC